MPIFSGCDDPSTQIRASPKCLDDVVGKACHSKITRTRVDPYNLSRSWRRIFLCDCKALICVDQGYSEFIWIHHFWVCNGCDIKMTASIKSTTDYNITGFCDPITLAHPRSGYLELLEWNHLIVAILKPPKASAKGQLWANSKGCHESLRSWWVLPNSAKRRIFSKGRITENGPMKHSLAHSKGLVGCTLFDVICIEPLMIQSFAATNVIVHMQGLSSPDDRWYDFNGAGTAVAKTYYVASMVYDNVLLLDWHKNWHTLIID